MDAKLKPEVVAIVIARQGSLRLPGKNRKSICGRPLVEWSMLQAQCSRFIDRVIMATDDPLIADYAVKMDVDVYWREDVKNEDPGNVPFLQVMKDYVKRVGTPEMWVTILPTSCLRLPDHFDRGIMLMRSEVPTPEVVSWANIKKEHYPFHNITDADGNVRWILPCMFDKGYAFSELFGGDGIWKKLSSYIKTTEYTIQHEGLVRSNRLAASVVQVDKWQLFEIDTAEEFEIVQSVMDHKIIRRYGADCYRKYKEGKKWA